MSERYTCPTCSQPTELHESPLTAYGDAFAGYVQCQECGSSSHEDGFDPIEPDGIDDDTADLF